MTPTNEPKYLRNAEYRAVVARRVAAFTYALGGLRLSDQLMAEIKNGIKISLGEDFNIWPESILPAVARATLMDSLISKNALQ